MKIAVLGGGISGLVAAYNLSLNPSTHVVLYEASDRFGGWLSTRHADNGALFDIGPHSMRCVGESGRRCLEFLDEIALADQIIPIRASHSAAKKRYLGLRGELYPLPYSLSSLITHPKGVSLAKSALKEPFIEGRYSANDESVYMYFTRRFGAEIADLISDPICRGISASDCRTLGVSAMFPQLVQHEYRSGSVIKGMLSAETPTYSPNELVQKSLAEKWRLLNFQHGMEQLPKALLNMLRDKHNVDIYDSSPVTRVSVRDPEVTVTIRGGQPQYADHIVSALPAFALAQSLDHDVISGMLRDIQYVDVALVSLEFRNIEFDAAGFGMLIPSYENPAVLGVIFDSCVFPEFDTTQYKSVRMSLMLGGEWFRTTFGDAASCDTDLVRRMALDTVQQYLGISAEPSICDVDILEKCIPHYTIGHRNKVKHIFRLVSEEQLSLSLVGAGYFGAGIPDLINNAIEHTEPLHKIVNDKYFSVW